MKHILKYGDSSIQFEVPETAEVIRFREPDFDLSKNAFCELLKSHMPEKSSYYQSIAIVVSDKTRLCGYPTLLPWVTEALAQKGIAKKNITFYIAYGTHVKQTEEESDACYGKTCKQYQFVHHDCRDSEIFTTLGITHRGTKIAIRKDILACNLVITIGAISYHYFAGFGGGRKLLFPGLGKLEAIQHNHGLFLDPSTKQLTDRCRPGILEMNPLAEDLREIDSHMPTALSIHGILNSEGDVCQLKVGNTYTDFISACRLYDSYFGIKIKKQFDVVIASGGGYPKDINFIQAHKALHHASAFVKDGGILILVAACIDGIGSETFIKYFKMGTFEKVFEILRKDYEGNGGTALSMMTKTNRIRVFMITSLDAALCNMLKINKVDAVDVRGMIKDTQSSVAIIHNASMLACSPIEGLK